MTPRPVRSASMCALSQSPSWSSTSPLITIVIETGAAGRSWWSSGRRGRRGVAWRASCCVDWSAWPRSGLVTGLRGRARAWALRVVAAAAGGGRQQRRPSRRPRDQAVRRRRLMCSPRGAWSRAIAAVTRSATRPVTASMPSPPRPTRVGSPLGGGSMLRTRSKVRVLGRDDLPAVRRVLDQDPITHVFVDHRVRATRLDPRWLGGQLWGYDDGSGRRRALPRGRQPDPGRRRPGRAARRSPPRRSPRDGSARRSSVRTTPGPASSGSCWSTAGDRLATSGPSSPSSPSRPSRWCRPTRTCGGSGPTSSTSSTRPASRCSPRSSASRRRPVAAPSSTGRGSPS